ncbi:NAD(P)H-dependent oxidoreductase [Acuticoccus kandeliae]|uniref:NAD(P)H-dependent oxidoreductase n=1 Tax=Acuticoccus kandeliae TaxID=2073160 RepID=UPI000D3E5B29|nr:NAD(P)H-dependent oxidoreductase [Acuticoccus kandeliae]
MLAHIVVGHPNSQSFNGHLARTMRDALVERGWSVTTSDLSAMGFDPAEGAHQYPDRDPEAEYNVQREQRLAAEAERLPPDVRAEIARLEAADLLIMQFPLWWFGPPAILKGWFDRVFVYGHVYTSQMRHDRGYFKGKRAMLSVTCGGPEETFAVDGRNGDIDVLLWPLHFSLSYVGYTVLEPQVFYGVQAEMRHRSVEGLQALLAGQASDAGERMRHLDTVPAMKFAGWDDWENGRLKPGIRARRPMMPPMNPVAP